MATQATAELAGGNLASSPERAVPGQAVSSVFQLRYALRLGAAVVLGAGAATVVAYLLLARELGGYAENMMILSDVRGRVLGAAVLSGLIHLTFTGVIVTMLALFASHRIAGPTVRLVRLLGRVAQGVLPGPVRFRHGDQVGALERHFNEATRDLRDRHETLTRKLNDVRAVEARLRTALKGTAACEHRRAVAQELREQARELAALLAEASGAAKEASSD